MDDEYNVINDGEGLDYPDDGELPETETILNETAGILTELNRLGRRSGKRKFCDIFCDPSGSHPIDWHMRMPLTLEERESKRNKKLIEEEILDRVTSRIVEARVRKTGTEFNISDVDNFDDERTVTRQVLYMPPTDGTDWMGISSDGNEQRFYIRMMKPKMHKNRHTPTKNNSVNLSYLSHIQTEMEKLKEQKASEHSEISYAENTMMDSPCNEQHSSLWVDKYMPISYADLVSDDAVNRSLLTWLKLWDECVFRRKIENLLQSVDEKESEIFCLDSGKVRRPHHKVLLLSGPPGLGKTTLAKIVAKHAGYDTVEVNASDSRTIGDFEKILEGAVRNSRTITTTGKGKPICLIIDEIDGAPIDSIRYLVRNIQATGKKMIRRPIICICNNLFVRSLRELRTSSFSLVAVPPKEERLIQRLTEISTKENICVDRNTLSQLVHMCSYDIRRALNILQYIASAKGRENFISLQEVQKAIENENIGINSIFDGWSAILEYSKHLNNKRILPSEDKRIYTIQRFIKDEASDRFITGLHSNYLRLPLPVKTLSKAAQIFLFHDEISRVLNHTQNYSVLRYELAFYALLHLTVATHHRIQMKFPQLEQNAAQRLNESKETISITRSQLSCRQTTVELVKDLFPFIVTIVQPPIKPMNEQLYGKKEREIIGKVVSIMHSFSITYVPAMVNSQVHYTFQPAIDILTLYNLSDNSDRSFISNSIRQMIARHLELFRVRSHISNDTEKNTKNKAIAAVENAQNRKHDKRVVLYFHFNHGSNNAVKRNLRLANIFP